MEQQTVSIAKAGITTSLNARACVVAAANPLYGRYNLNKSPVQNINLPESLLSRFDLQFVLIDKVDADADLMLALHVGHVHQYMKPPQGSTTNYLDENFIRAFIAKAQEYTPVIESELSLSIVNTYAQLRSNERSVAEDERQGYTSPRTLLGILRLSQARARLRLSNRVEQADFEEAVRLMEVSKDSCNPEQEAKKKNDTVSEVYRTILGELNKVDEGEWVSVSTIERVVLNRGYTKANLDECLKTYVSIDCLELSLEQDRVRVFKLA
jgi:DNA replication licensing factor MCM7